MYETLTVTSQQHRLRICMYRMVLVSLLPAIIILSLGSESRFTSLEAGLGNNLSAEQRTVVHHGLHERDATFRM